ncbi:hypothetical protein ACLHZT_18635, partial [Aeromonas veronii]|uniref:hypothetical protein n=1 Tax=Aeromonas veronii TaxID=654 RepID=UPI003D079054
TKDSAVLQKLNVEFDRNDVVKKQDMKKSGQRSTQLKRHKKLQISANSPLNDFTPLKNVLTLPMFIFNP